MVGVVNILDVLVNAGSAVTAPLAINPANKNFDVVIPVSVSAVRSVLLFVAFATKTNSQSSFCTETKRTTMQGIIFENSKFSFTHLLLLIDLFICPIVVIVSKWKVWIIGWG